MGHSPVYDKGEASSRREAASLHIETARLPQGVRRAFAEGKDVWLTATGRSMIPFLADGTDSVCLVPPDNITEGDVVLAETTDGRVVLHRVMRLLPGGMVELMGDGNLKAREHAAASGIAAKATVRMRGDRGADLGSPAMRRLWRLWRTLLPVRRPLLAAYKLIYRRQRP